MKLTTEEQATGTTPLSLDAIALLQKITKGIESGELSHIQEEFHCRSSHCIAGWVEVFSLQEAGIEGEYLETWGGYEVGYEVKWYAADNKTARCSPLVASFYQGSSSSVMYGTAGFAVSKLGLTKQEGLLLFDVLTPFWLIQEIVRLLSEGYRLNRSIYISDLDSNLDEEIECLTLAEEDKDSEWELSPNVGDLSQLFDYCGQ